MQEFPSTALTSPLFSDLLASHTSFETRIFFVLLARPDGDVGSNGHALRFDEIEAVAGLR